MARRKNPELESLTRRIASLEERPMCCRPISLNSELEENGAFKALRVQRLD